MASDQQGNKGKKLLHLGNQEDIVEKQENINNTLRCNDGYNLTILSKHGERSDELYARCVHGDQDHTVLAMPKKQV